GCSRLDPGREITDNMIGEFLVRRHANLLVLVAQCLQQKTLGWLAGNDGWAVLAAFKQRGAVVHAQAARYLVAAVTLEAGLDQHGSNLGLEERVAGFLGLAEQERGKCDKSPHEHSVTDRPESSRTNSALLRARHSALTFKSRVHERMSCGNIK